MPVIITDKSFSDNFGNSGLTGYVNNAGDRFGVRFDIEEWIRILSGPTLYLSINPIDRQIEWVGGNFLEEGFRNGDNIIIRKYDEQGNQLLAINSTINYVNETIMDVTQIGTTAILTGQRLEIENTRNRSDLDVFLNHVLNSTPGTEFSLIDGEGTRVIFEGLTSLSVNDFQSGQIVGNQSGQFLISAGITRRANNGTYNRVYELSIDFVNSGIYDSEWFDSTDCLKLFTKFIFASLPGESDNLTELIYNENADTGYFNEAFNAGESNSTLIQGVTDDISYCEPSTHTIIVDGPTTDIGIGSAYISIDESYYKNRELSQNNIAMIIPTSSVGIANLISSNNEFNAGYQISIDNVNTVGTQTEITFTFTPNNFFNTFMDSRDVGDRLFYIWVKCGNINHLAYGSQLECVLPEGDPIVMIDEAAYLDHSQNVNEFTGIFDFIDFDTEDDAGFYGSFLIEKNKIYENLNIKIEAYNPITDSDFTLNEFQFSFSGVQISNDGRYLLDESQNIISTLPSNSLKLDSIFKLRPDLDTGAEYGVSIYAPILLRWEYWLEQLNASPDFYPTQNKNWEQYDNLTPWIVRLEILLSDGLITNPYRKQIIINPYDFEDKIISNLEIFRDSTGQNVNIVIEGELMRVVATHEYTDGEFNPLTTWGMITVEPFESAPRTICSSVLPFDNDNSNPLKPLDGTQMVITFPAPNIARMECFFDTNLIDTTNGVKFTTKIKDAEPFEGCVGMIYENDDCILLEDETPLIVE